MSLYYHHIEYI